MDNPWARLPSKPDYVLPEDRDVVVAHNEKVTNPDHGFVLDLLPEPFLGPPDAAVVLLNVNPASPPEDYQAHNDRAFHQAHAQVMQPVADSLRG